MLRPYKKCQQPAHRRLRALTTTQPPSEDKCNDVRAEMRNKDQLPNPSSALSITDTFKSGDFLPCNTEIPRFCNSETLATYAPWLSKSKGWSWKFTFSACEQEINDFHPSVGCIFHPCSAPLPRHIFHFRTHHILWTTTEPRPRHNLLSPSCAGNITDRLALVLSDPNLFACILSYLEIKTVAEVEYYATVFQLFTELHEADRLCMIRDVAFFRRRLHLARGSQQTKPEKAADEANITDTTLMDYVEKRRWVTTAHHATRAGARPFRSVEQTINAMNTGSINAMNTTSINAILTQGISYPQPGDRL
jgi:hypothetical protein